MSINFNVDLNKKSDFDLSFLVYVGQTHWYQNGQKQQNGFLNKELKQSLPKDTIFNISSLVFNLENHKQEVLGKYSCFYQQSSESLCILVEESAKYIHFSREIMINLMEFAQKLGINAIFLLIARKNKEFVRLLQGMLTVGFEQEEAINTTNIGGKVYKVLKMNLKQTPEEIQEIDF